MSVQNDYIFEKLTPVDDSDISVYEAALDFVFKENDVRNVAISGAYGAGKSSVLASYKKKHPTTNFVHVSLAHFQKQDESENDGEISVKESVLEGKILNQLIHQIPSSKIPQTNFRIKSSVSKWSLWLSTIAVALLLLSLLHCIFFDEWAKFVNMLLANAPLFAWIRKCLSISIAAIAPLISGGLSFILICIFLFQLIKVQKNRNVFRKLSFQGNEIEIFEESEESYFDKYLNEVLYLFENTDANVIVFEDMDRFDASNIFERLREINTLANLQRAKESKGILRFFYLLRDDIFISKDRTKFFDCIIPVVPVVDSSNSYNQFISHLKKNKLFEEFDEGFLQGLSLYVDDMRLLKNICNELLIYYNRLNTTELDYNKMLALITYKNLFPRDFSDLQLNKGFVWSLFSNKERFIQDTVVKLRATIGQINQRISDAESELTTSMAELDLVYKPKRDYYGRLNSTNQAEYDRRAQALKDRNDGAIQRLKKEISELEWQIKCAQNSQLAAIITRDNIDQIFNLKTTNEIGETNNYHEIKGSEYFDLVKYLIRNGYIDETYADYMTYFYEDSLSRIDKTFLRSITDRKAKPYSYELKDVDMVYSRLKPIDFDQEEVLNFQLCEYLFKEKSQTDQLAHLVDQLRQENKRSFVAQFFDYTKCVPAVVRRINKQWPSMFTDMQEEGGFNQEQVKRYSVFTLYYSEKAEIKAVDSDGALSAYITDATDYLEIEEPQIDKLIRGFKLLGVYFPEIDYACSNRDLLWAVYKNNLYVLNFKNLKMVLQYIHGVENLNDIRHKSYTKILELSKSPIFERVDKNMVEYLDLLLSECDGQILDDENTAITLLNRTDIGEKKKQEYIGYLKTPISFLYQLEDKSIWESLISSDILLCSETNIMDYFAHSKNMTSSLVRFINKATIPLDFSVEKNGFLEEQRDAFFDGVVKCNEIDDSKYRQIVTTIGFTFTSFDIPGIKESKMNILVDNSIINMNVDTLKYFRENYVSCLSRFIRKNIDAYVGIMSEDIILKSELLEILSWDVADELKLKLLSLYSGAISIIGKGYSDDVCKYILKNNLLRDDMHELYLSYDKWTESIRDIILAYAREDVDDIIDSPGIATDSLKDRLIVTPGVSLDDKVDLVVAWFPNLGQVQVCRYLSELGFGKFCEIFDSHARPKFEANSQNIKILEAFKRKKWIFEYVEDDTRENHYKIHRKEPRKAETNTDA